MKRIFIIVVFALLLAKNTLAQDYKEAANIKYNSESVIVENFKLQKGDTIYLGFGSGGDKQFVFVFMKPNVLTYNPGKGLEGVPAMYANARLKIESIAVKKVMGNDAVDIKYSINGKKVNIGIDLYNAFKAGEIRAFSERCLLQK